MELALTWAAAAAVIWIPGLLLERSLRLHPRYEPISRLASQLALGLSIWPIFLLWTDVAGLRWTPALIRIVVAGCAIAAALAWLRRSVADSAALLTPPGRRRSPFVDQTNAIYEGDGVTIFEMAR